MMKRLTTTLMICAAAGLLLTACASAPGSSAPESSAAETSAAETSAPESSAAETSAAETSAPETSAPETASIDYLVLVNKENPLPEDWESIVQTVHVTNSLGDDVEVEQEAYDAYLEMKAALEQEGVKVDLDSARRSVAAQQKIVDEFTEKYGELYVQKYVAVPGYSEHHTGLALDLYLNIDGEDVYLNEDMVTYPEIWEKIHAKLAEYGFILRYLEGKEAITGYSYEPWHIRYVKDPAIAKEITDKGITLEEYLNRLPVTDVAPPKEDSSDAITLEVHTEGMGEFAVAEAGATPEFDPDFPKQDFTLHLSQPETRVLLAKADDGWKFVKWTKDGADFSKEAQITVELSENVSYTAVFEAE